MAQILMIMMPLALKEEEEEEEEDLFVFNDTIEGPKGNRYHENSQQYSLESLCVVNTQRL